MSDRRSGGLVNKGVQPTSPVPKLTFFNDIRTLIGRHGFSNPLIFMESCSNGCMERFFQYRLIADTTTESARRFGAIETQ
ncbi:hypothetical protein [Pseudomonas frederiksbergensis]|uniref:hypothetical protein n=1 Tax=Pseudomonas frederiksbergensis TaxID=104087 RepID=UPI003D1F036A